MIQHVHLKFQYDDKVLKILVFQSARKFCNNLYYQIIMI